MDDNKLIAEFMGRCGKEYPNMYWVNIEGIYWTTIENMKFNTSWDWLMPVVEKIEAVERTVVSITYKQCVIIDENYADLSKSKEYRKERFEEIWVEDNNKLEATYKAVVEFIKWYNKIK